MLLAILLYLLDRIGQVRRHYLPFMLFQHGNLCATAPAVHNLSHIHVRRYRYAAMSAFGINFRNSIDQSGVAEIASVPFRVNFIMNRIGARAEERCEL